MSPAIIAAALSIDVPPQALAAVVAVESSGSGVTVDGPVIRLEVHKLWSVVPAALHAAVDERFRVLGPKPWQGHEWRPTPGVDVWKPMHVRQVDEHAALRIAKAIDVDAAIRATSYGLGQVLGENWRRCGFASPVDFEAHQATEAGQIDTMARFIAGDPVLLAAVRVRDWRTVARLYNGAGKVDDYAAKLAAAYKRLG